MSASRVFENLTKNQYVGVGLAAVVVAVAAYFLLKKAGTDLGQGLKKLANSAADATGYDAISSDLAGLGDFSPDTTNSTFVSWYDPTQRTVFFYYPTFPDGSKHIIGAGSINSDGTFDYDGNGYRLGNAKAGDVRAYPYDILGGTNFGTTPGGDRKSVV